MRRPSGSAALVLVGAGTPLRVEPMLFDAMLEGWRCQHMARRLSPSMIRKSFRDELWSVVTPYIDRMTSACYDII
ncbi:unnamed protein product [Acidithrix sp. C25]|nr:unnamed protein product [Acidithrix sp. C25]